MKKRNKVIIDAGVVNINIQFYNTKNKKINNILIANNDNLRILFKKQNIFKKIKNHEVYITGKLAEIVKKILNAGNIILSSAALWSAGIELINKKSNKEFNEIAIIDLSASGYLLIGINKDGKLKKDTLIINSRCGAGSGVNLDRILQKLAIDRNEVDKILFEYIGNENKEKREKINIRADRCGVFSSSATISDKNQGIPLSFALATTLKSEVVKTCIKLPNDFKKVYLTGRVFSWQFARDCARDILKNKGVEIVEYDENNSFPIIGVLCLTNKINYNNFNIGEEKLKTEEKLSCFPSFQTIKKEYEEKNIYQRLENKKVLKLEPKEFEQTLVYLGLDVGSTMAKLSISNEKQEIIFLNSYSNSGDTIDTIKSIFRDLQKQEIFELNILDIGITGSARYQVEQALTQIFPQLKNRVSVLVENYAHARGSINYAREHIKNLKSKGIKNINDKFCILVDIGGEDTKLSTITLEKAELFDNAMNIKCSAGTGSLMDTLTSLFGMKDISEACSLAFNAKKSYSINATCAVFLMENARKLQAQGYPKDEILASANWAIVENMARSLWSQIDLPKNAITLLHGQTMLSDPLPLAVCSRLQEFTGSTNYCLVPPSPGHRACMGLISSLAKKSIEKPVKIVLQNLIEKKFTKQIIVCKGIACGDSNARCNRTFLSATGNDNKKFNFTLGGCTAINELFSQKGKVKEKTLDSYQEIWNFIDSHHSKTNDKNRLIIPRSFAVSEWAYFISRIFENLGIKTHVDNIQKQDLINAQPLFNIDTCAPHIGAVGQYQRLANEAHGIILAPQIDFLPTNNKSKGKTCTLNQGGIATAKNLAELKNKKANFHLFNLNLTKLKSEDIANGIFNQLQSVFTYYKIQPSLNSLKIAIDKALEQNKKLKNEASELGAKFAETALKEGKKIALVIGREYILNPGIYDSHAGRLLRDKGMIVLPSYIFDIELDDEFKNIYWKNPHFITSLVKYSIKKTLYKKIKNKRLSEVFEKIEKKLKIQLPIVQVSTFRCGPDSVTTHLIAEMTKKRPFLLIQSDAIIKELAHLENRVNTYTKQLEQNLHSKLLGENEYDFKVEILNNFINQKELDKKKDVIYFPTLSDNRTITSVIRSAGFTCLDNYKDESYNLSKLIKKGRKYAGDTVCAPLAAVYADSLLALEDFKKRKINNDPLVKNKNRVLIFNNTGSGPCRQGQYADTHKLFAYQKFSNCKSCKNKDGDNLLQFLIADEKKGYDFGIEKWTLIHGFKGAILQGVLHQLKFKLGANCKNIDEYNNFISDFKKLKQKIFHIQENIVPKKSCINIIKKVKNIPIINLIFIYFGYKLNNRDVEKSLAEFALKWKSLENSKNENNIKIHIDGEVYMRVSQSEEIFRNLLSILGFNKINLEYSPLWSYFEYVIQERILSAENEINKENNFLKKFVKIKLKLKILNFKFAHFFIRNILAKPLYNSANISMPTLMSSILKSAKNILPTLKPRGELAPYTGEAIHKLETGTDLFLNIAPEGCMVSSMGEVLTPKILEFTKNKGKIQNLFSQDGEINEEILTTALLKILGPEKFYRKNN
ncbi:hypothetical protein KAI92_05095 [Candidatus Parcubacteria bacterium]|nr:hypothetical protein [Candidatus Parcubacteria bacterium]